MTNFLPQARLLHAANLAVMPAQRDGDSKRVALKSWKEYQTRQPTGDEIQLWFGKNGHNALCIAAGIGSGNVELIDFDQQGELFAAWCEKIDPALFCRLVIETTPSGGFHVIYRSAIEVCGNCKLAQRKVIAPDGETLAIKGKGFKPRKEADRWYVTLTLIETRGQGGMFLCAPSPGYEIIQGDLADLPVLTESERDSLLRAAWSLNEVLPEPVKVPKANTPAMRPGDEYSRRGDVEGLLVKHGWTKVRDGVNEYWRRPGKSEGWSATLKDRVFYVHSSNADPFTAGNAYGPFAVYALLEHGGDYPAAAAALRADGFGGDVVQVTAPAAERVTATPEPGYLAPDLLRVPGFMSEVMDYCLSTAPYPNQVLAFCGALSLMAFLAGQKITDDTDSRTNLYVVALAASGTGKDHPRKINQRIAAAAGLEKSLGDRFASGQGLEDRLLVNPSMLYQVDEMDSLLDSITGAKLGQDTIATTLLSLYTQSNGEHGMRDKAGAGSGQKITNPSLCLLGTAIPAFYYKALSEKVLRNGLFSRMLVFEAGQRGKAQIPKPMELPAGVVETALAWAQPVGGNLTKWYPKARVVPQSDEAAQKLLEVQVQADAYRDDAEAKDDNTASAVWTRAWEKTRKLALIYAASESHANPQISLAGVRWAWGCVESLSIRMLWMAGAHVARSPFHAECLRAIDKLRHAKGQEMSHSLLLKNSHMDAKHFTALIDTLSQRGDIEIKNDITSAGRNVKSYKLIT